MKFVTASQMSGLGKAAVGLILTLGAFFNVPQVAAVMGQVFKQHPHISFTVGAIVTLASLLVNPQVQKIIGLTSVQPIQTSEGAATLTTTTEITKP
jgi:hypothetical protein